MKALTGFIAAGMLASAAAAAQSTNFSYTYAEVGVGQVWPDEDIVFEGHVYDDFALGIVSGSYQFADHFALRLTGSSMGAEEGPTEITQAEASISVTFPFAVARRLDVVPLLGFMSLEVELCDQNFSYYSSCFKDDETGMLYGVLSRYWALEDQLEINAGLTDSTIEDTDPSFSLGGAYWFGNNHSVRANFTGNGDFTSLSFGYAYSWR